MMEKYSYPILASFLMAMPLTGNAAPCPDEKGGSFTGAFEINDVDGKTADLSVCVYLKVPRSDKPQSHTFADPSGPAIDKLNAGEAKSNAEPVSDVNAKSIADYIKSKIEHVQPPDKIPHSQENKILEKLERKTIGYHFVTPQLAAALG